MPCVAWPRGRNKMQRLCSQTQYPTAVSTRKRGCATFSYLGDAGSPPPEALSLLDIKGSFGGYSWAVRWFGSLVDSVTYHNHT